MPRKNKDNHAVQCKPVYGGPCKRSRDGRNSPVRVARPCPKCGEMRCCAHCGCARRGVTRRVAKARARPRRTPPAASSSQGPQRQTRPAVVLPLRQETEPRFPVQTLGASTFWDSVLKEVAVARKTVFVGSLTYDNSKLQTHLVAARARGVKVEVVVDRVTLQEGGTNKAAGRLNKLKEQGVKVYLASGRSYKRVFGVSGLPGHYHAKVVCVDGAVAFVGSPNSTNNSLVNGEVALRVSGEAVTKDVYNQAWAEAQRVEPY